MMTLADAEQRQEELLRKVQNLFENEKRTQKDMDNLYQEIRNFEKEKAKITYNEIYGNNEVKNDQKES